MELLSTLIIAITEWQGVYYSLPLISVIIIAGLGTTALFVISVLAFIRRQTRQYFLVVVALGALVLRSVVGLGTALAIVPMAVHHLVEHGLDVLIAALILYAVYLSGPTGNQQPSRAD